MPEATYDQAQAVGPEASASAGTDQNDVAQLRRASMSRAGQREDVARATRGGGDAPVQLQGGDTESEPTVTPTQSQFARVGMVEPHLTLRAQPDPRPINSSGDPLEVAQLAFNDRVQVIGQGEGDWLQLRTDDGKEGYASRLYVFQNAPEPDAKLYKTKSGDTALGIAQSEYQCGEWGADGRFYTNVLVNVNGGEGNAQQGIYKEDASGTWQTAKIKAGYYIWVPSQAFARTLQGVVSSGSISYEAADAAQSITAFIAGYATGLWDGLADAVSDVVELVQLIWSAVVGVVKGTLLDDLKAFWDQIVNLDAKALLAAFEARWNNPDSWEKWKFRGWVIGFVVMLIAVEVLLAVVTGGAGNAARWSAKLAKLSKLDKLLDFLKTVPAVQKATKTLQGAAGTARETLGDMRKLLGGAVEGLDQIKDNVRRRIDASPGLSLKYTDAELASIVEKGRSMGLDNGTIEDLIFIGSREAKRLDADTLVKQMDFYVNTVMKRGFPAKFTSLEEFNQFGADLRGLMTREKLPVGDLRVQGSSLRTTQANDIDLVTFVDPETYAKVIGDALGTKVKTAAGETVDLSGKSMAEMREIAARIAGDTKGYNAHARTFAHAITQGNINSKNKLLAGLKKARKEIAEKYPHLNIESIAMQSTDSAFDLKPSMKVP